MSPTPIACRLFWGAHVRHGYWDADEPAEVAQVNLVRRLARAAVVPPGARVLDVGCGLGGPALWLAGELGCRVTGLTISPAQARTARRRARRAGLDGRAEFLVRDANDLEELLPAAGLDVIWSIEGSEHVTDKGAFFVSCSRALRTGGKLALCAWLNSARPGDAEQERLVAEVCRGTLRASLPTRKDYLRWLEAAGFEGAQVEDLTRKVEPTWDLCLATARRRLVRVALWFLGRQARAFVASFQAIRRAYTAGALAYGMFTARKR
jgi:tocopherol O-methyltransferase